MEKSSEPHPISFEGHLSRRRRKILLAFIVSLLCIVAISVALLAYFLTSKAGKENTVREDENHVELKIRAGVVQGRREGKASVFKGIPYAKPPIKRLRWKPPVPCEKNICWVGKFDAGEFGSICAQQDLLNTTGDTEEVIGEENCLFINVWTPQKRANGTLLPVLVFIHGGFLLYLSGNWQGLHPSPEMVVDMNIVGVSFNYRLNAFGFLALEALANDSNNSPPKTSGNYGFMDQILALKWVQANIETFGGDPDSVTLMGSSSGGTSELALLASRNTTGLFHRAILMSASAIFNKSFDEAAADNRIFLRNSSCEGNDSKAIRDCLYELTPRQIQDAIPWNEYPNWRMDDLLDLPTNGRFAGAVAVVDKDVVMDPPLVAIAAGKENDVPLIIGTTAQESDVAPPKVFNNFQLSNFLVHLNKTLGSFPNVNVSKVRELYGLVSNGNFSGSYNNSIQFKFTSMVTDVRATCPNNRVAQIASHGFKSPVYRYVVTNSPSEPVSLFGFPATFAFHMWDLIAFFGFPSEIGYKPSDKDKNFMNDLRREFGEFIRKNGRVKMESWEVYPKKTALFTDSGVQVPEEEYHKTQCDFWLNNEFFSYAWIN